MPCQIPLRPAWVGWERLSHKQLLPLVRSLVLFHFFFCFSVFYHDDAHYFPLSLSLMLSIMLHGLHDYHILQNHVYTMLRVAYLTILECTLLLSSYLRIY
jgi:hypothetical protein